MSKVIAVDFDGTCVTHAYPEVGVDIGAVPVLRDLIAVGHRLILYTMRSGHQSDASRNHLADAWRWAGDNGVEFWAANENPEQSAWSNSRKVYAHLYIDDAALGCPMKFNPKISDRLFVDWEKVRELLVQQNYLKK